MTETKEDGLLADIVGLYPYWHIQKDTEIEDKLEVGD
jgi:hypothetical protein